MAAPDGCLRRLNCTRDDGARDGNSQSFAIWGPLSPARSRRRPCLHRQDHRLSDGAEAVVAGLPPQCGAPPRLCLCRDLPVAGGGSFWPRAAGLQSLALLFGELHFVERLHRDQARPYGGRCPSAGRRMAIVSEGVWRTVPPYSVGAVCLLLAAGAIVRMAGPAGTPVLPLRRPFWPCGDSTS